MIRKINGNINSVTGFGKRYNTGIKPSKKEDENKKADNSSVSASPEAWQAATGIFKKAAKTIGGALYYVQTSIGNNNEDLNSAILEDLIPYGKDTMRRYEYYINEYHDYPEAIALINCIACADPKMLTKSPYILEFAQIIKDEKKYFHNKSEPESGISEMFRLMDIKDQATISGETPGRWAGSRDGIAFAVFDTIIRNTDVSAEDKCDWLLDVSEKLHEKTDLCTSDFRKFAQDILKEYREFAQQQ